MASKRAAPDLDESPSIRIPKRARKHPLPGEIPSTVLSQLVRGLWGYTFGLFGEQRRTLSSSGASSSRRTVKSISSSSTGSLAPTATSSLHTLPSSSDHAEGSRSLARTHGVPGEGHSRSPIDLTYDSSEDDSPRIASPAPPPESSTSAAARYLHQQQLGPPPIPTRPDVSVTRERREYPWLSARTSPTPSSSSSTSSARRKRSSSTRPGKHRAEAHTLSQPVLDRRRLKKIDRAMQEGDQKERGAWRRAQLFFRAESKKKKDRELSSKHISQLPSLDSKAALAKLLVGREVTLADRIEVKPPVPYKPEKKQAVAKKAKDDAERRPVQDIHDILERIRLKDEEDQRKIQERLQPPVPTDLKPEQNQQVQSHLKNPSFVRTVRTEEVRSEDLSRLRSGMWLNDAIMNTYGALLLDRAEADGASPSIHFFNSFFYQKLSEQGYEKGMLKRWTKRSKTDIFAKDVVLFPINLGNAHWTAAAINMKGRRIEYYDSMGDRGGARKAIFRNVREYLKKEHQDKKGSELSLDGWEDVFNPDGPQQDNGSDCGVFSCQTLEAIARGRDLVHDGFDFGAKHMAMMRKLMVLEIAQGRLEKRW